jgi:uncharacterized RDD family membrane protein YckC
MGETKATALESAGGESAPTYQGLGRRSLAALLDNLTWLVAFVGILLPIGRGFFAISDLAGWIYFVAICSAWFNYFALTEWHWGQTIGKNAVGIQVKPLDGDKLTYGQSSLRNLLRVVDFFGVGWVMIATTERHQRLGDKAARTVVVRRTSGRGESPPAERRQVSGG